MAGKLRSDCSLLQQRRFIVLWNAKKKLLITLYCSILVVVLLNAFFSSKSFITLFLLCKIQEINNKIFRKKSSYSIILRWEQERARGSKGNKQSFCYCTTINVLLSIVLLNNVKTNLCAGTGIDEETRLAGRLENGEVFTSKIMEQNYITSGPRKGIFMKSLKAINNFEAITSEPARNPDNTVTQFLNLLLSVKLELFVHVRFKQIHNFKHIHLWLVPLIANLLIKLLVELFFTLFSSTLTKLSYGHSHNFKFYLWYFRFFFNIFFSIIFRRLPAQRAYDVEIRECGFSLLGCLPATEEKKENKSKGNRISLARYYCCVYAPCCRELYYSISFFPFLVLLYSSRDDASAALPMLMLRCASVCVITHCFLCLSLLPLVTRLRLCW